MGAYETSETKKIPSSQGSLLRQERERRYWTQSSVAERIGTTQINISRWENGITAPSLYYRQKLSELFEKSVEELGLTAKRSETNSEETTSTSDASDLLSSPPLWSVPYRRNPFFTGRKKVLADLHDIFENCRSLSLPLAISGLGGIGKTQIAVEYAYYHYLHSYQHVLWINATTHDTLTADFVTLAARLKLPEQHEQDQNTVVRAVKRWLITHTDWLLVLDNVDKLEVIVNFLPTHSTGDILLTTRLQAFGPVAQCIEIEKMGLDEGAMLLLRRSKLLLPGSSRDKALKEHREKAIEIVAALDGLPLAIDQAGAYIEETRCELSQYLDLYATHRKELLLRRGKSSIDHPDSVATTWSISFQKIEQESPVAADLLHVLAFLDPEVIPEEIITQGAEELGPMLKDVAGDPLHLNMTIELLLHYSLIRRSSATKLLSIHHLIQAVLKDSMDRNIQQMWAERTIRAVNRAFPHVEPQTWETCQRLLPHMQKCVTYVEEYSLTFSEIVQLFNKAASYQIAHSRYKQTEVLLLTARKICSQIFGNHHLETAHTLNNLGELYLNLGNYQKAKPLLNEALKIREQLLGEAHSDVAQTLYNLASLHRTLGNYVEAEPYYEKALYIRKTILDIDHPLIAQSHYGLARLYFSQGKYCEAEEAGKQALLIREKRLKEEHPLVVPTMLASTKCVLAKIYLKLNKFDEAQKENEQALEIREKISGENHQHVAIILNNLVEIYHIRKLYKEAEPLIARAIKIHEEALGTEHPYTAYGFSNKAHNLFLQGVHDRAEFYYKKALLIRKQRLGSDHPHTASTYHDLAKLYSTLERYEEAASLYHKVLSIYKQIFGQDHPLTIHTLEEYNYIMTKRLKN